MIGIYKIINISSKKVYIGQSKNIEKRWREHIKLLKKGNHHSIKLQRSWNKSGENKFEFEIIEECSIENLDSREQHWIDYYDSINKGFNIVNVGETPKTTKQKLKKKKNTQRYNDFILKLKELENKLECKVDIECELYKENLLNNKYSVTEYSKVINLINFILNYYKNNYDCISEFKINRYIIGLSHQPKLIIEVKHNNGVNCNYLKNKDGFYIESNGKRTKINGDDYE